MDERRATSGMADSSVMSEYFATMRQFLETQERVMSSFLGDGVPARPALRSRPLPALPRVAELAAAPAVTVPVAAPVAVPAAAPAAVPAAVAPAAVAKPAEPAPSVSAPVPQPSAPAAAAAIDDKAQSGALSREKLLDMLLGIVEEKTGYPRDMVGLDQNLEADLGIDSIKRVEVVGAMLQLLPAGHREALADSRSKLNTQATLNGMLDLITQAKVGGAATVPFDLAGAGAKAGAASHPSRLVMRPRPEPLTPSMARRQTPGRFVVTRDRDGVADALTAALAARGVEVSIVEADVLRSEPELIAHCAALGAAPVAGVVHLAALGAPALDGNETPAQWREVIQLHEKSFFVLLRELSARLVDDAHVVAASGLGGLFGREGSAGGALHLQGGAVGALKSLLEERPALRVKAVDLDPLRSASQRATDLQGEIELDGGRQEVGYPGGERTVFATVAEDLVADAGRDAALKDLVVLATGGARGITAEVLRELARPGTTFVLTGRSALQVEAAETAALAGADALRSHFVAQVRSGAARLTPGEIQRRVRALLDQREMRSNIADFEAAGAAVEYHAIDVTDEGALSVLLGDVRARLGRIDGVVHGAGVIEDKRLADKASDSWSRVVETKVIGALLLQKHLDPAKLKFFTVFSSVAGRYGNSGQSDYATANELMNRLCVALQARWGDGVAVSALCWGPWGATKFGAGMVTAETEAKFAEKGVRLVTAALGRRLFRSELARRAGTPVEVICGEGPWEEREVALGQIQPAPQAPDLGPLLGAAAIVARPTGERVLAVHLDLARHRYLVDHTFDRKAVLPAAAALELMAEAARALWPGWKVVEVREHRLLSGVDVDPRSGREMQVLVAPAPYGSAEGFEVNVALQSAIGAERVLTHYRCVVRLAQALAAADPVQRGSHDDKTPGAAQVYREWLSHGPRLQMIERIEGLSPQGASAHVRSSSPADWLATHADGGPGWVFDPAWLDAAAQMAWIWSRAYRDETALPARFGRVVRLGDCSDAIVGMEYRRLESGDPHLVRGDVFFFDAQGAPVMVVEELESVASAALNRLGGGAVRAAQDEAA